MKIMLLFNSVIWHIWRKYNVQVQLHYEFRVHVLFLNTSFLYSWSRWSRINVRVQAS